MAGGAVYQKKERRGREERTGVSNLSGRDDASQTDLDVSERPLCLWRVQGQAGSMSVLPEEARHQEHRPGEDCYETVSVKARPKKGL